MVLKRPNSNEPLIPTSKFTSPPEQTPINSPHPLLPSSPENPFIAFNISAHINEKLTLSTFPQWRAQFEAFFIGYDLLTYVTGDNLCPKPTGSSSIALQKTHWIR